MASGMRLIVSCISSFLILSLLLFMVHRLRQRRRERIESLIGANRECPSPCCDGHSAGLPKAVSPGAMGTQEAGRGKEEGEDIRGCQKASLSHPPTCSWAEGTPGALEELFAGPEIRGHGHVEKGRTSSASRLQAPARRGSSSCLWP